MGQFTDFALSLSKQQTPIQPAKERGVLGDLGSDLLRGGADALSLTGHAIQTLDGDQDNKGITDKIGNSIASWAEGKQKTSNWLKPDESEVAGTENGLYSKVREGVRSIPTSLAPLAVGAAGSLAGGPVVGGAAGLATLGGLFGLGTYDQTRQRIREENPAVSDKDAHSAALKYAAVESVGELVSDAIAIATGGVGKVFTSAGKQTVNQSIKQLMKISPKKAAKDMLLKTYPGELATEAAQGKLQSDIEQDVGIGQSMGALESLWEVAIPTAVMTLALGSATNGYSAYSRNKLLKELNSEDQDRRVAAARMVNGELKKQDKDVATAWRVNTAHQIKLNQPIDIDEKLSSTVASYNEFDNARSKDFKQNLYGSQYQATDKTDNIQERQAQRDENAAFDQQFEATLAKVKARNNTGNVPEQQKQFDHTKQLERNRNDMQAQQEGFNAGYAQGNNDNGFIEQGQQRFDNRLDFEANRTGKITPKTSVLAQGAATSKGARIEQEADYQSLFNTQQEPQPFVRRNNLPVTADSSLMAQGQFTDKQQLEQDELDALDALEQRDINREKEYAKTFQDLIPPSLQPKIALVEQKLAQGEVGHRFQKEDGSWGGVKSTNPDWLKKGALKEIGKDGIRIVINNVRKGKKLTPRQQFHWNKIKKAAEWEWNNDPSTTIARESERIEREEGIPLGNPQETPVGNLNTGDKVVVQDAQGMPDVVTHKGYDDKGQAILKDGVTIHADPWDTVDALGIKESGNQDAIQETPDTAVEARRVIENKQDGQNQPSQRAKDITGNLNRGVRYTGIRGRVGVDSTYLEPKQGESAVDYLDRVKRSEQSAQPFDPNNAIQLIADDVESIRPQDVYRLLSSYPDNISDIANHIKKHSDNERVIKEIDDVSKELNQNTQPQKSSNPGTVEGSTDASPQSPLSAGAEVGGSKEDTFDPLAILKGATPAPQNSNSAQPGQSETVESKQKGLALAILSGQAASAKVAAEDWANRKYKKNDKAVSAGGDNDNLNASGTTIGAANERRRNREVEDNWKKYHRLNDAIKDIENGADPKQVMTDLFEDYVLPDHSFDTFKSVEPVKTQSRKETPQPQPDSATSKEKVGGESSNGQEVVFPFERVRNAFAHTSLNPSSAAKVEQAGFERIVNDFKETLEKETPQENIEKIESYVEGFKRDFISEREKVWARREVTVSSHIAGKSKFNSKQAGKRGNALDRAEHDFDKWIYKEQRRVFDEIGISKQRRNAEAKSKQEKSDKKEKALKSLAEKIATIKKGEKFTGGYSIVRVSKNKDGYPSSLTVTGDGIIKGVNDKIDIVNELFGRDRSKYYSLIDEAAAGVEAKEGDVQSRIPNIINTNQSIKETVSKINKGELTLKEYQGAFKSVVDNQDAIKKDIATLTVKQMQKIIGNQGGGYKKADYVRRVFSNYIMGFHLDGAMFSYGMDGIIPAMQKHVDSATEEKLKANAAAYAERQEEYKERLKETVQAIKDPQTLDDFITYLRAEMSKDKNTAFKDAYATLTQKQKETYDRLAAEDSRGKRLEREDSRKTEVTATAVTMSGEIVETKHTKTDEDLFVVKPTERVGKDVYRQWLSTAKRLGGWYSRYSKGGAIPGFQFKTMENAEAFLAYLGGDTEQAQQTVKERRDAFKDDKSQTAVERLTEMAERLEDRANDALNQDRKTNTARRASMAASAEASAESDKALAKTMKNIANAIESGEATFLDRVRQKVQVEELRGFVNRAKYDELKENYPDYQDYLAHQGEPATSETVNHAEYPSFTAHRGDLAVLARQLLETKGAKKTGQSLLKVADDVTKEYLTFARENLHKVTPFAKKNGQMAVFSTKSDAQRSILRSGFNGQAIVLPFKRGENIIILSPQAAKEKGLWEGLDHKRISLSRDFGRELLAKTAGDESFRVPYQFKNTDERLKRLEGMGIATPAEFRAALREFVHLKEEAKQPDKVKELERSMVGRVKDGLDFFPTPETVVDEMLETANIQEGMKVLEPSAGMGHIADKLKDVVDDLDVVEVSSKRRELLELKGHNLVEHDFLDMEQGDYDRIVMNPPFSKQRDIDHVKHAYELLKPGGRIVAIMGESSFFNSNKKATAFREWMEEVGATNEHLEDGVFNDSSLPVNTGVAARMVVIDKQDGVKLSKSKSTTTINPADINQELSANLGKGKLRRLLRGPLNIVDNSTAMDVLRKWGTDVGKFSKRAKPAPKNTVKSYKLFRVIDGVAYPLFIDQSAGIKPGEWYDADSPLIKDLEGLPANNTYLVDKEGNATKQTFNNKSQAPTVKLVKEAGLTGKRYIYIGTYKKTGEKSFHNWGINGSGGVASFAMRPGWHSTNIPAARHIGKRAKGSKTPDYRRENEQWAEIEIAADVDYHEEAASRSSNDIQEKIPKDGYYSFQTNSNAEQAQDWLISGSIKINRFLTDKEAAQEAESSGFLPDLPREPIPGIEVKYSKNGDIQGITTPDGKVYLVEGNIEQGKALSILAHELGVHAKQAGFKSEKTFQGILRSIERNTGKNTKLGKLLQEASEQVPDDTNSADILEERLSYLVENHPDTSIVRRFVALVKKWMVENVGISADIFSAADFHALAMAAIDRSAGVSTGERVKMSVRDKFKAVDTKSKAFRDWFGDSIVNHKVYHHSDDIFDEFKNTTDIGYHFGTKVAAKQRAEQVGSGSVDIEVDDQPRQVDFDSRLAEDSNIKKMKDIHDILYFTLLRKLDSPILNLRDEVRSMGEDEAIRAYEEYRDRPDSKEFKKRVTRANSKPKSRVLVNGEVKGEFSSYYAAEKFAKQQRRVLSKPMEVYLRLENPIRLLDLGVWSAQEIAKESGFTDKEMGAVANKKSVQEMYEEVKRILTHKGHDGIVYKNEVEDAGSDSYIVFNPTQIKSAISNTGDFSPTDPRIKYSKAQEKIVKQYNKDQSDTIKQFSKPDIRAGETIIKTPEYILSQDPTGQQMLDAALNRRELKFQYENNILDGITEADREDPDAFEKKRGAFARFMEGLKKKAKGTYTRSNKWLLDADRTGKRFRLQYFKGYEVVDPNGELIGQVAKKSDADWVIHNHHKKHHKGKTDVRLKDYGTSDKVELWTVEHVTPQKDGKPKVAQYGTFSDEHEAVTHMVKSEAQMMRDQGHTEQGAEAVIRFRNVMNRGFDVMIADMRRIIQEAEENGQDEPSIDYMDETRRWGVFDKKNDRIGEYASQEEAKLFAEPLGLKVKKQSDNDIKKTITYSTAIAEMGDLRGSYFPRQREQGGVALIATNAKTGDKIRENFDFHLLDKDKIDPETGEIVDTPKRRWMIKTFNKVTGHIPLIPTLEKRAKELKAKGYKVEVARNDRMSESVFEAAQLGAAINAMLEEGLNSKTGSGDLRMDEAYRELNKLLSYSVADIFKQRGYLSSRLRRNSEYWRGFEEDMSKAAVQYSRGLAAGMAKRKTAQDLTLLVTGRDVPWSAFKADGGTWEEYNAEVKRKAIDPKKQGNLYTEVMSWMKDILRNDEQADRVLGTLKGLAVMKFLSFRVSSAAVNATNLMQAVPATISSHSGGTVAGALKEVGQSIVALKRYRKGQGSSLDKKVFTDIAIRGWDEAQFNHESANVLRSKAGEKYSKFVDLGMSMFGWVEKVNRATTIHAAYKQFQAKHPDKAQDHEWLMKKAKTVSDRAHGVYGKETAPVFTRGKANPLKLTNTFMKFSHNYVLNTLEMFGAGKNKQAAYMLLSPMLLGGAGASVVTPALSSVLSAMGFGDDPEEEMYQWAENNFGSDSLLRHGLPGLLGMNFKGSLQMNNPVPSRIEEVFGAPGSLWFDFRDAYQHLKRGEVGKAIEKTLPTGLGSPLKALREYSDGVTTGSYSRVYFGQEPLKASGWDATLRFFSFNPSQLSGKREKQWRERKVAQKYAKMKQSIGSRLKKMWIKSNGNLTRSQWLEIVAEIDHYNSVSMGLRRPDVTIIKKSTVKSWIRNVNRAPKRERQRAVNH